MVEPKTTIRHKKEIAMSPVLPGRGAEPAFSRSLRNKSTEKTHRQCSSVITLAFQQLREGDCHESEDKLS